ncbi:MAG: AAA family ATPase [Planctomycetes bacterium]|nr:AAA family ATPase [Planctomycetota bacterium]
MERITIDDVELVLTRPVEQETQWIGQEELVDQILAAWLVVGEGDLPLCPRLLGKPGVGKTTLAYFAARTAGLPAYIHQCTVDTRPEDLLVTPVLSRDGKIAYHASSLVSAMLKGGVAILDEANRMSEKSWASLAPLLDHRRYVESIVAGIRIPAHPSFRACITMNEDASTYEIPDYMLSRIQPAVEIGFPERDDELKILRYHLPFAPEEVLEMTVEFLQGAHVHGLPYSTRDGINIARFAVKLGRGGRGAKGRAAAGAPPDLRALFEHSVRRILGEDAFDLESQALVKETPELLDLRELFAQVEGLGESSGGPRKPGERADEGDEDDDADDPPRPGGGAAGGPGGGPPGPRKRPRPGK